MRQILHVTALGTAFAMSVAATLAWAWTGGVEQLGLTPYGDPTVTAAPGASTSYREVEPTGTTSPTASFAAIRERPVRIRPTVLSGAERPLRAGLPAGAASARKPCHTGPKLVPTCGVLWGVAPGARTEERGPSALADFERKTGRHQAIYHAYHHGIRQVFPTEQEIAIARQPGRKRILLLNWKPESTTWAGIARGDRRTDEFLDRMAEHLHRDFHEPFFFAIHHEAEDQVRERPGSGYTARDYAAMFRHVVRRLRAHGATNMVTVLVHMAYVPHTTKSWFSDMYPGDGVVDWIGFDTYSYSDPGYGHGDFEELLNRRSALKPRWPGFYNWVRARHPGKPLMVAEWGVWFSKRNPGHMAEFYREVGQQIGRFPAIKAMVHFETPANQKGQDSSVDCTPAALREYRRLGKLPVFQVSLG
ncbi:glycosyl hydrolase [Actinoplanes oblitus]|uniref:Glycosyl hydrolase n=1 Tax=Actinoplanes oblitus TaxID=3040509 RepID=A0ABY8WHA3_9ACTN|nr:glycosyl hydrolase [Actinoplanes oblitus]WIM97249.1 glycosyl hydrolase [Actinoplanes oblitus]